LYPRNALKLLVCCNPFLALSKVPQTHLSTVVVSTVCCIPISTLAVSAFHIAPPFIIAYTLHKHPSYSIILHSSYSIHIFHFSYSIHIPHFSYIIHIFCTAYTFFVQHTHSLYSIHILNSSTANTLTAHSHHTRKNTTQDFNPTVRYRTLPLHLTGKPCGLISHSLSCTFTRKRARRAAGHGAPSMAALLSGGLCASDPCLEAEGRGGHTSRHVTCNQGEKPLPYSLGTCTVTF
jgi:hypothetical protein